MPITNTEFLENEVKVHYHLHKPYGIKDVDDVLNVPYANVDKLPNPPEKIGIGESGKEAYQEIHIPKLNKTIIVIFDSYRESSWQTEEDFYGPYLKE